MRIHFHQLEKTLQQPTAPAPVFFICGNEPLQLTEGTQAVRDAASRWGYTEREVLEQGPNFDWSELAGTANALSLFAAKKLIELRLASNKVGSNGSKLLIDYCSNFSPDNLLLITGPKLERSQLSAKWMQAIDRQGVVVQVWPVETGRLPAWLESRMRTRGLQPAQGVAALLAERVEGNLVAGTQEIEKLLLRYGPGPVDCAQLLVGIADSSRYDVFDLANAALLGDLGRVARIFTALQGQGTPLPIFLWALAREIRTLAQISFALRQRRPLPQLLAAHGVWDKRKPMIRAGLKRHSLSQLQAFLARCVEVDQQIKGQLPGDPWDSLLGLATELAGAVPRLVSSQQSLS